MTERDGTVDIFIVKHYINQSMKICPNCDFENFDNPQNCNGCGQPIQNIRPEFFTITDFIKKNSEVYAVIGIFLALFEYFFKSQNPIVNVVSLFPLFVAIYLMFSLIIKGNRIVRSQVYDNPFNRYFNPNSFELWVFLSINVSFIVGLILMTGTPYILSICLLGCIAIICIIFVRRISNERNITTLSIWLNLVGIFYIEVGWLVFQYFFPSIKSITDPTILFWTLMIPLSILFFGIGTFLANMFIGTWIIITGGQRNIDNNIQYSWASLRTEFFQYINTIENSIWMNLFLGMIVLLGIGIVSIFLNSS